MTKADELHDLRAENKELRRQLREVLYSEKWAVPAHGHGAS